ncbi:MAG: MBL fold metallo-hydrolase [Clostridia bacterium]|nr:MBL fold metallo-hydrolase [Clostridia bacterium]
MIKRLVLREGPVDVCSYFYIDDVSSHGFLFDPGAQAQRIISLIGKEGYKIDKIIITHGHFDHIGALDGVREKTGIPAYIHENGKRFLSDPHYNLSERIGRTISTQADGYFRDGDVLTTADGGLSLRVIHTPGHTDDSCVFYSEKEGVAFTGDTIFKGTFGNYRFPTGDYGLLMKTIREKVLTLPEKTVLYSGHTEETTVEDEAWMYL